MPRTPPQPVKFMGLSVTPLTTYLVCACLLLATPIYPQNKLASRSRNVSRRLTTGSRHTSGALTASEMDAASAASTVVAEAGRSRQDKEKPTPAIEKLLRKHKVARLESFQSEGGAKRLVFRGGDATYDLLLMPHDLRSPRYRAEESDGQAGERRQTSAGAVSPTTFKGVVAGVARAEARFTIDAATIEGSIITGDEVLYVEPLGRYTDRRAAADEYVVYSAADVIADQPSGCGLSTLGQSVAGVAAGATGKRGDFWGENSPVPRGHNIELATEADYDYVRQFPDAASANTRILQLMNQVEGVYQYQLGVTFAVVYQHTWTTDADPYSATAAPAVFAEFRDHWNANFASVARDLTHMWTGRDMDGDAVGYASLGSLCRRPAEAYGVTQFGVGPLRFANYSHNVTAHEIGHNLGATHPDQETSPAAAAGCTLTLMYSQINTYPYTRFCEFSRAQILAYLAQESSCLTPTYGISGRVTDALGRVIANAQMKLEGDGREITAPSGYDGIYFFNGLTPSKDYTVSISLRDHAFAPPSRTFINLSEGQTAADFVATTYYVSISGRVVDRDGSPVQTRVDINEANGNFPYAYTSSGGEFTFKELVSGRDYTLRPRRDGITFTPQTITVTDVRKDVSGVTFSVLSYAPTLLRADTGRGQLAAAALDSVNLFAGPFKRTTPYNFSADGRTRITLFAISVQLRPGEGQEVFSADIYSPGGRIYPLAIEYVGAVPGFDWLTQVVVLLPEQDDYDGDYYISVGINGAMSGRVPVWIQK